jgi:aminopeptidase N
MLFCLPLNKLKKVKQIVFIFVCILIAIGNIYGQHQHALCKHRLLSYDNHIRTEAQRSVSSANYDVTYYKCFWENTPNDRNLRGIVTVYFKTIGNVSNITLDLATSLTVNSVVYHGARAFFSRPANGLTISFSTAIANNIIDSVTIDYSGTPETLEGYFATGTHSSGTSAAPYTYTLSQPYGARYWWPCKDNVQDKADSIDIYLTYPNQYMGVANGILASETDNGVTKTSYWKHRKPIVPYLVAFAISNYSKLTTSFNGITTPIINYVFPESISSYNSNISRLGVAFTAFQNRFGSYPFPNDNYSQTQIRAGVGGMEHQTNSFIDSWDGDLMAHELMHQWFGDMVTCNTWKDIWLNEGFATYGELVYLEDLSGTAAKVAELRSMATSITGVINDGVIRNDTSTVNAIFNYRMSYLKGAYIVNMLRWVLGETKFNEACKNYLKAPGMAYGFSRTDSLKKYMELSLGKNLNEFFNDWVYGLGHPSYTINWNQDANNNVVIKANQATANSAVSFFEMPIPVKFIGTNQDTTIILDHTSSGQIFNFPLSFQATSVQFDPDAWILSRNNMVARDAGLTPTGFGNIIFDRNITIVPTFATDNIQIINRGTRMLTGINIVDANGKMVYQSGNTNTINTAYLPKGKYFIRLKDAHNKIIVKSFVKQ